MPTLNSNILGKIYPYGSPGEVAHYAEEWRGATIVCKVSGSIIGGGRQLASLVSDISDLKASGIAPIIVQRQKRALFHE